MKYRITSKRWDDDPQISVITASSDDDAKRKFEEQYVNNKSYDWDYLFLERIDVIEKTTHMASRISGEKVKYFCNI